VSATGLVTAGAINLYGSYTGNYVPGTTQATLDINPGAAPTTLLGTVNIDGNALLEFESGGIATIAAGAQLSLNGSDAFLADAGHTGSNSALTGLSLNLGTFGLYSNAVLSTTGNLTNVGELDDISSTGVTLGGTLTNYGTLKVESYGSSWGPAAMTVGGLSNLGSVIVSGQSTTGATLDVTAAAPTTLTGSVSVGEDYYGSNSGSSLLEFASGGITNIGVGANLLLFGSNAFVANAIQTSSNSALTGLSRNDGNLLIDTGG
jgi:hypothetical protein